MPQKKHKPEEIVAKLRQVDVLLSQGRLVAFSAVQRTSFTRIERSDIIHPASSSRPKQHRENVRASGATTDRVRARSKTISIGPAFP